MRHHHAVALVSACTVLVLLAAPAVAQETGPYSAARPFGTLRQQAAVQQAWLKQRLEVNLPAVMRAHGVDMWVVSMREYNEDPVFRGLVSATTFAARRRSIYVFFDRGGESGVERLALGGTAQGGLYEAYRGESSTSTTERAELWGMDQWRLFARLVRERNPKAIAINASADHNFADGLTLGEWEQMKEALGPELEKRVGVRNPRLAIDYLALRVAGMAPTYRRLQTIVHEVISAAFSNLVIIPGVTTTEDVVWWMRQRVNDMRLGTWFQPSVEVQRMGASDLGADPVILRGDVLHCDFGITAMGLNTDTQHMAYVLKDGETEAPAGLSRALANANRLQDILLERMKSPAPMLERSRRGGPARSPLHDRKRDPPRAPSSNDDELEVRRARERIVGYFAILREWSMKDHDHDGEHGDDGRRQ